MSGPILGYVFDPTKSAIRPALGIPGAAAIGEPVDLGFAVSSASISPRNDYAIVFSSGDTAPRLISFTSAGPKARLLDDLKVDTDGVFLSPSGSSAAFYHKETGSVLVIAGLPGDPRIARELKTGEPIATLAISDDGSLVLASTAGGKSIGYLDESGRRIAAAGRVAAIAFEPRGHAAVLADAAKDELWLVRGDRMQILTSPPGAVAKGTALLFAGEEQVFLATSDQGKVYSIRTEGTYSELSCNCASTMLARMTGHLVYLLNDPSSGPVMLLDAGAGTPRVLFVPSGDGQ